MIGYLECSSGISGDMIVAAMIDAGAPLEDVNGELEKLPFDVSLVVTPVLRRGIAARSVSVQGDAAPMRTFADATSLLERSSLGENVKARAEKVLRGLAAAEAKVHDVGIAEVRFHEIGITDTVADAVAASAALETLDLTELRVSPIATGKGSVETEHGRMPLPVPAVVELLRGFTLFQTDTEAELVTPTGAAVVAAFGTPSSLMPSMKVSGVGYGAGSRDLEIPNVTRLILGETSADTPATTTDVQVEANIDDMNPEFYEYVSERLFDVGALDVWVTPGIGKRGRPLQVVGVLAPSFCAAAIHDVLITETSTIGVRMTNVQRWMAEREWLTVEVVGRPVRVKVARHGGRVVNVAPEYWDCAELARTTGLPVKEIFRLALAQVDIEPALPDL